MTNINKVMNLAIYHPSERVRKKNQVRFFNECVNIKDDYERGKIIHLFFDKGYVHNKGKYVGKSTYLYQMRKQYLHGSRRVLKAVSDASNAYLLHVMKEIKEM